MRAETRLFLWGTPYATAGDASHYAHWYALGSSLALAENGNQYNNFGNSVDVYRMGGQIMGWVDYPVRSPSQQRRLL